MQTILVTGFAPFGSDEKNAAWEAVTRLPDELAGVHLEKRCLPVAYNAVGPELRATLEELRPAAVLCVGQAAGRAALTPEKVAINWRAATIADNDGCIYVGEPICPGEADAYFSTLPVEAIAEAMKAADIPAQVSYTAGTYVCNSTMYHLLRLLRGGNVPGGFLHVPYTCAQAAAKPAIPSLPLELIVEGLKITLEAIVAALPAHS